jgi:hypothetical protein
MRLDVIEHAEVARRTRDGHGLWAHSLGFGLEAVALMA